MNDKIFRNVIYAGTLSIVCFMASSAAVAGTLSIADSYHNLGSNNKKTTAANGTGAPNHSTNTGEICVFCHTPHGGDNSAAAPLWNRVLSASQTYTRYSDLGTSTFDATEAPVGSVTVACLSCHDGTQAIDSVINAPGSGGYNAAGSQIGGFAGGDATASRLSPGIVQNLGTDLSNDHPVSMQYGGGGVSTSAVNGPTIDPDFVAGSNTRLHPRGFTLNNKAAPANGSITRLWWIERNADSLETGNRDRSDVWLYTRLESETGVAGGEQPFVECGSCHDPHNVDNPTFLRVSNGIPPALQSQFPDAIDKNEGSGLCLTCHTK